MLLSRTYTLLKHSRPDILRFDTSVKDSNQISGNILNEFPHNKYDALYDQIHEEQTNCMHPYDLVHLSKPTLHQYPLVSFLEQLLTNH